jgi:histidine triad (HIT) family protein
MTDCLFCRIVAGEISARFVHQDDEVVALHDISPQAPVHLLVIPRRHVASLAATMPDDEALLGRLMSVAADVARRAGLSSWRLVANNGAEAGQSVDHLHLHVLGGREFRWPPG